MSDIAPTRVRIDLTPPQAVSQTSGLCFDPTGAGERAAVALAPGAGSDLMHPVLLAVGKRLAEAGHPTLLFNFAYTEAGRKRPDPPARLERAYADVLAWLRERYGADRRIVMGGLSLGGRIASHLAAEGSTSSGLVLLGYPLHPRQRRTADADQVRLRTQHWDRLRTPMLFVQGDRDALCDLETFAHQREQHLSAAETALHVVSGGDHAFNVRARDPRSTADVLEEVSDVVVSWVAAHEPTPVTG